MATSNVDRRALAGLKSSEQRIQAFSPDDKIAATLVQVSRTLIRRAADSLERAMAIEDKEETEAIRAADRRRRAFDKLGDAFSRLYDGLTAGVALARLRGVETESVQDLKAYLDETTPSAFRALSFGASLSAMGIARRWADEYLPSGEAPNVLPSIDLVIEHARQAQDEAKKEGGEAAVAFRELESVRVSARRDYLAARNALMGALNLTGTADQLNRFMPAFDRVIRAAAGRPSVDDGADEEADPDVGDTILG